MDIALEANKTAPARRGRGRPAKAAVDKRTAHVSCWMTPADLAEVDARRGILPRGEWIRAAAFASLPPAIPPAINIDALRILSKVAGNLATVASAMRGGDYVDIERCREAVASLRGALTSAHQGD